MRYKVLVNKNLATKMPFENGAWQDVISFIRTLADDPKSKADFDENLNDSIRYTTIIDNTAISYQIDEVALEVTVVWIEEAGT